MEFTIEQAQKFLNLTERDELQDHAFGDAEVYWYGMFQGQRIEIACGFFGGGHDGVSIYNPRTVINNDGETPYETVGDFKGDEARRLRTCGKVGRIDRNDETGPDRYTEGDTMPGLSKGDVFHELTGNYLDGS